MLSAKHTISSDSEYHDTQHACIISSILFSLRMVQIHVHYMFLLCVLRLVSQLYSSDRLYIHSLLTSSAALRSGSAALQHHSMHASCSALHHRKRVFVPTIAKVDDKDKHTDINNKHTTTMRMYEVYDYDNDVLKLPKNNWNISQPTDTYVDSSGNEIHRTEAHDVNELSLIIVPAVAFDKYNNRLGHGKGYYDTYLQSIERKRNALQLPKLHTIGICLSVQYLSADEKKIPVDEHDLPVEVVLKPK
jgi:5-formyltetrahydrofolate cyclo-ligase